MGTTKEMKSRNAGRADRPYGVRGGVMTLSVGIRDYGQKEFDWVPDIDAETIHDAVKHAFVVVSMARAFDWSVEVEVRTSSPEDRPNDLNVVHRQRATPAMIARWISA